MEACDLTDDGGSSICGTINVRSIKRGNIKVRPFQRGIFFVGPFQHGTILTWDHFTVGPYRWDH